MSLLRAVDGDKRRRLFCFNHAGAGTAEFRKWASAEVLDGVDICPLVLPGRESRLGEASATDLCVLADQVVDQLAPVFRQAPFAFYGHSMGSWLAWLVACRLTLLGRSGPRLLMVGARRAPDRPARLPTFAHTDEQTFLRTLQERHGALPEALLSNPRILRMFLPALRSDFAMLEAFDYHTSTPMMLTCPIVAFSGTEDGSVTPPDAVGWKKMTTGAFEHQRIAGGHFFHRDQPAILLQRVRLALEQAWG